MSEARETDPEGTNAQLLANALSRAEIAENDLRAEILHSAETRKERDNARSECAWLAKRLIRLREALNNIALGAEDEGDRVYFGSTNDADWLKEIARDVDAYAFDRIMRESKWPDYIEAAAKANARADAFDPIIKELANMNRPTDADDRPCDDTWEDANLLWDLGDRARAALSRARGE